MIVLQWWIMELLRKGFFYASFFLCKELLPGYLSDITGEYATPEGYLVDEKETEEFDKMFPYKEKKKLPGQLF